MPSFPDHQSAFAKALVTPSTRVPEDIARPEKNGAKPANWKRFDIYRNNVTVTMVDALSDSFPAVFALVGEEFFQALARAYIDQHKPTSPLLFQFGATFGDFMDDFAPVAERVPYLGDVARLEYARLQAYHARDAAPAEITVLGRMDPDHVADTRFTPHPSAGLVRSRFPVVSLWGASVGLLASDQVDMKEPQDALIVRPALNVDTRALPDGGGTFAAALFDGKTLGDAASIAATETAAFDLSQHLSGLFGAGAFETAHDPQALTDTQ